MPPKSSVYERAVIPSVGLDAEQLSVELDQASAKQAARILIVDDQSVNLRVADGFDDIRAVSDQLRD
jgi:hypothetical protein